MAENKGRGANERNKRKVGATSTTKEERRKWLRNNSSQGDLG